MQTEMFPSGLDIERVIEVMIVVEIEPVRGHRPESVMVHGMHVRNVLPNRLSRVGLYHDMGRVLDQHDHPSIGAEMARALDFEQWEQDLVHYHHALFNLVNLGENLTDRAVRRFLTQHRDRLEELILLARADVQDLEDNEGELARLESVIHRIRSIDA